MPPPKTNVLVVDNYFTEYDTLGQIGSIKFVSEFERLEEKIEKFWKLKGTGQKETENVKFKFGKMIQRGKAHSCQDSERQAILTSINIYMETIREYYDMETKIKNFF